MKAKSFTKSFESKNCSSFVGLQCTIFRGFFYSYKGKCPPLSKLNPKYKSDKNNLLIKILKSINLFKTPTTMRHLA